MPDDGTSKPVMIAKVAKARAHRKKLLTKVATATKGEREKRQKEYLGSSLVRLSALTEAAGRLEYHQRRTIPEYEIMAAGLTLFKPINEDVFIYLKPKGNDEYRYFCDFGVRHRAAQALVADLVRLQFKPRPYQYDVAGRGVRRAVQCVRALHAKKYVHGVRLDVKRFYDSFHHQAILSALPLPKAVIEHVVIGQHYNLKQGKQEVDPTQTDILSEYQHFVGQSGIPQGSACSPVIGQFFVSKLGFKLPKGAVVLNYADDFLVLAQSPEKGEKATNALHAALAAVSVGNFELREKSGSSIHSGFEFLGHHFSETAFGKLRIDITPANQFKVHANITEEIEALKKLAHKPAKAVAYKDWIVLDRIVKLARHIMSWVQTFSEADEVEEFEQYLWTIFKDFCKEIGIDPSKPLAIAKSKKVTDAELYG